MSDFRHLIERYTPKINTADYQKARVSDGHTDSLVMYKQLMALSNFADSMADVIGLQGDAGLAGRIREFSNLMRNEANKKKNS